MTPPASTSRTSRRLANSRSGEAVGAEANHKGHWSSLGHAAQDRGLGAGRLPAPAWPVSKALCLPLPSTPQGAARKKPRQAPALPFRGSFNAAMELLFPTRPSAAGHPAGPGASSCRADYPVQGRLTSHTGPLGLQWYGHISFLHWTQGRGVRARLWRRPGWYTQSPCQIKPQDSPAIPGPLCELRPLAETMASVSRSGIPALSSNPFGPSRRHLE